MKTNILSKLGESVPAFLLAVVLMFSPIMPIQTAKASNPADWAAESVSMAYEIGIIPDYMARSYEGQTTRIDFV